MGEVRGSAAGDASLTRAEYRRLVESAETYRKELVVRLVGEAGLRTAEIPRVRPEDVRPSSVRPSKFLLDVRDADGDRDRVAYLPSALERSLDRYVRSNGVASGEPVVDVSVRRVQMLIADVARRAAERTGDERFANVSASDVRDCFASTLLVEDGVDPRVVRVVGGWQSLESFDRFFDAPDEATVVDAMAGASVGGGDSGGRPSGGALPATGGPASDFDAEFVRTLLTGSVARALVRLDADGYVERWLSSGVESNEYERRDLSGRHLSSFYAPDDVDDGLPRAHLEAAVDEGSHEVEGWRFDADGERFWARAVLTARETRGRVTGFTLALLDLEDRKRREDELRERVDALERRGDVRKRFRSVDDALLSASDRDELETAVCERLAAVDEFAFAWVATSDLAADRCTPTASAGVDPPALESLVEQFETDDRSSPWVEALHDGGVRTAAAEGPTDADAVAAVPIAHRETTYGVLAVATVREEFADWERAELADLGRRIGHAVTAIQRRSLLLSDAVVELEFRCRDDGAVFVDVSDRLNCTFTLASIVPVSASSLLFYVTVEDAPPGDVFEQAVDRRGVEEVRLVETHDDGALLEFVVGGDSPLLTLTAYGATITEAVVESGEARLLAEVARDADLRAVVDGLRTAFPRTELVGKHEVERPVRTVREFREGVDDELTDRQEASLRAAYYAGYFDWPRGSTAEEIADSMEVSSPTLHNHLRKGQRALLETFFEGSVGGE